ncbi:MAG: hypothetical protein QNJ94_17260 [Alphaproteobacteria bacterium]|nr:hypothetical protein [Alphaproteobacteria bacterium]
MADLFTSQYSMLWALVLGIALFFPVRQLIWSLSVRRAQRKETVDEARSLALKRRATVTAVLLCFVFSFIYTTTIMQGR